VAFVVPGHGLSSRYQNTNLLASGGTLLKYVNPAKEVNP